MFTVEHNRYTKFILSKDILTTRADNDLLFDIHKLPWLLKNVQNSEISCTCTVFRQQKWYLQNERLRMLSRYQMK